MTTMRTTLTRAVRMSRAVQLGDAIDAEILSAALEDAQGFFLTHPIRKLTDVLIDDDYEAEENERITWTSGSPTVTYPTTITEDGTDRTPQNGAIVETTGTSGSTRKIYIAELKTWMPLTGLTLASEQPFGPTHDADVAAMICARICGPVLQVDTPDDVLALANRGRTNIRNAFRQIYTPNFDRALLRPVDLSMEV